MVALEIEQRHVRHDRRIGIAPTLPDPVTERQLNHCQAQRLYLWRGPTLLRGLLLSPNSQAAGRAGAALDLPSVEGRIALSQLCERRQLARRSNRASGESFPAKGSGPRAPGRRNFVTFVTLGPKSILLHATGRQSGTARRSSGLLWSKGSSSNLPNGRRHFGQPRTCSQGGTAGERAARLLGSRSPPTPCVPFAEEFQPYTKSKKQYRTMGSHPLLHSPSAHYK